MEDTKEDLLRKAIALRKARGSLYDVVYSADVIDAVDDVQILEASLAVLFALLRSAELDLIKRAGAMVQIDEKDC